MTRAVAQPVLVSACLLGINCRYDGGSNLNQRVIDYLSGHRLQAIPVCPEQLAGLPTPRPKAWFTCGDGLGYLQQQAQLHNEHGHNVGPTFLHGARETLKIARFCGCSTAIMKERSPSCGRRQIYRHKELVTGTGLTSALLQQAGITVTSEEELC
jgi:uncharacterized protein YbbK (DUF523 family)